MSAHTLPPVSYNSDEDWLRPILGALLVHLLVVLIFGLAWLWSPTRNTRAAAGTGTLEASLELSGAEIAAAQRALNQSIQQSINAPNQVQPVPPSRQVLPSPTIESVQLPEAIVPPIVVPDTREQMRALAEQQRQQQAEIERQRQAELLAEQQRQQQAEAERQRQIELLAEQQRQQEEVERQRQAELLAEQQRQQQAAEQLAQQQEQEQQEVQRQQRLAEIRQRREQVEQQAAQEQQRLERIRSEQQRANQAAATANNATAASSSSSGTASAGGNAGVAGAGGESNELLARYVAAIQNAILGQWTRPESVPLGQTCRLTINQMPGGQVINVQFTSSCPYDQAGRDSVERAILRASPLPYRGFENVFDRTLNFNFKAQDR